MLHPLIALIAESCPGERFIYLAYISHIGEIHGAGDDKNIG